MKIHQANAAFLPMAPRLYVILLSVLTALFALRIAGQLAAAVFDVSFLPQFKDWYSGLVPYPLLLPVQILLLGLMLAIVRDIARAHGFFCSAYTAHGTHHDALKLSLRRGDGNALRFDDDDASGIALVHRYYADLGPFRTCFLSVHSWPFPRNPPGRTG